MNDDLTKDLSSRQRFLGTGSAALAAAGMLAVADASGRYQKQDPTKSH